MIDHRGLDPETIEAFWVWLILLGVGSVVGGVGYLLREWDRKRRRKFWGRRRDECKSNRCHLGPDRYEVRGRMLDGMTRVCSHCNGEWYSDPGPFRVD